MDKVIKALVIIVGIIAALFTTTFVVYMFNLDMKLMAFVEPYLEKIYDKRKRDRRI